MEMLRRAKWGAVPVLPSILTGGGDWSSFFQGATPHQPMGRRSEAEARNDAGTAPVFNLKGPA
jgi:hypothetical protein